MSDDSELPLYSLFREWQQADINQGHQALDIEVYFRLLEAVNRGIGWESIDSLFVLCRLLLVKPHHNLDDFKLKFDNHLELQSMKELLNANEPTETVRDVNKDNHSGPSTSLANRNKESDITKPTELESIHESANKEKLQKNNIIKEKAYLHFGEINDENDGNDLEYNWDRPTIKFKFQPHYLSVDSRSMQQNIRSLRQQNFRRQQLNFDLNATINRIAQRGYFDQLALKRTWTNRVPLVLLIDRRGSMVAFHALCDELREAASDLRVVLPKT